MVQSSIVASHSSPQKGDSGPFVVSKSLSDQWPDTIISFGGIPIDVRTDLWRVGVDQTVDLSPFLFSKTLHGIVRFYLGYQLRNYSPDYVENNCRWLSPLGTPSVSIALKKSLKDSGEIGLSVYKAFRDSLAGSPGWLTSAKAAYIRWYLWSCDAGLDEFDEDVAIELEAIKLTAPLRGQAVLSEDPQKGPLSPIEVGNLLAAMRGALLDGSIERKPVGVGWLMIAFGMNSKNLRLLEEKDAEKHIAKDGSVLYTLRVPRIKKRRSQERAEFRTRSLDPQLGNLLEEIKAENIRRSPPANDVFCR